MPWSMSRIWMRHEISVRFLIVISIVTAGLLIWTSLAGGVQPYETYEGAVVANEPVAQFRFNDAPGSGTIGDSFNSYTATNSDITLGDEGPFGGSKSGSFVDEAYASLPSSPLEEADAFTVEGWVYWTNNNSNNEPIFDFGSSPINYMYLTPGSSLTGHKMLFEAHTSSGGVAQVTATTLKISKWEYIVVTETSSGVLTLYVNGEQVGQTTGAMVWPSSLGHTTENWLGRSQLSGNEFYVGRLSNVAFYTKALSASQIQAHYDAGEFPVNTSIPVLSGEAKDGKQLSAKPGSWSGLESTFGYQWLRCNSIGEKCVNIAAATGSTYTLLNEDVGATVRVAVTATSSAGSSSAVSEQTSQIAGIKPANTTRPSVMGTVAVGQLLTAGDGSWEGSAPLSYTYEWQSCNHGGTDCQQIPGADGSSYRVLGSEVGLTLRLVVAAANSAGNASATSVATTKIVAGSPVDTALPAISGTSKAGQTLSASTGSWAGTEPFSYSYQWQSCNSTGEACSNISGATGSTYALTSSNVGDTLRVIVAVTNSVGSVHATSSASGIVAASGPPLDTVPPAISGSTVEGQTLTVSAGSWVGAEPIAYTYQWQRCTAGVIGSGGGGEGQFAHPGDVAVGANGDLWVVDYGHDRVDEFNGNGEYLSQFGSTGSGSGQFDDPSALAIDPGGDIWVADTGNNRVEEFSPQGEYMRQLSALGSEGQLEDPEGIVIGHNGDVWVSETSKGQLAVFSSSGGYLKTVGAEGSEPGQLGEPEGIAIDSRGDVWTADWSNNRVEEFNENGEYLQEFGTEGQSAGQLDQPYAIAVNSGGDVWVGNAGDDRVEEFTEQGEYLQEFGAEGSEPGQFGFAAPIGIALSDGDMWITDAENDRIEMFNERGEYLRRHCTDVTGATSNTYSPAAADVGASLQVIVTAANADGEVNATSLATAAVSPAPPSNTQRPTIEGNAEEGEALTASPGVWMGAEPIVYSYQWQSCNDTGKECSDIEGAEGPIYIVGNEQVGRTLQVIVTAENAGGEINMTSSLTAVVAPAPPSNTMLPTVEGKPREGQTLTAATGSWLGTPPLSYTYQWQSCNALGEGCIAIPGAINSIYWLEAGDVGATIDVVVTAKNTSGSSSATSRVSTVVSPNSPENTAPPTISGTIEEGQTLTASTGSWGGAEPIAYTYQWQRCTLGEIGSTGSGDGQLNHPGSVAVDSSGNFWIVDHGNDRVEEFNDKGEYLNQFGSAGSGNSQFDDPTAVAIATNGDLWIVDTDNNRVEEFSSNGEYLAQLGSRGSGAGQLSDPEGIAIDAHGNIWVSDTGNARLEEFSSSGEYLRTVGSRGSGTGQLEEPEDMAIDAHGNIWVADWINDRVEEFNERGEYLQEFGSEGSGDGQFEYPYTIAVSPEGNIWVGDVGNNRIEEFNERGEYVSQIDSARGSGSGQFHLGPPMGLTLSNGDLWLTDSGNSRLEEFDEQDEYLPHQCVDIAGATNDTYSPTSEIVGSQLRIVVTATNTEGESSATSQTTSVVVPT
jgi:streptogramin lyase